MTQALSTLTSNRGIAPVTRAVADLTSRLHNKLEPIPGEFRRCALSAAVEPTAEQRSALIERRHHLDEQLHPCEPDTVRRAVGMIRSVMAVQAVDTETAKLQRAAFLTTLTKYPGWAVEAACAQFLDGQHGEGVHAPKPGEIAIICRKLIAEAQYERAKINAVLDAEIYVPPTDAQRAEVAKAMEDFASAMARAARNPAPTQAGSAAAERSQALDDLEARAAKLFEREQAELASQLKAGGEPFEAYQREDVQ